MEGENVERNEMKAGMFKRLGEKEIVEPKSIKENTYIKGNCSGEGH